MIKRGEDQRKNLALEEGLPLIMDWGSRLFCRSLSFIL